MNVIDAINLRRAYRSLEKTEITENLIKELSISAQLAPSCFNNQPWRFVFVYSSEMLEAMYSTLPKGNSWAKSASLIVAVFSNLEYDCRLNGRDYYLFDTGLAMAFLILRATELGFVAHPIAGYDEEQAKKFLEIPDEMTLITLLIIGRHSKTINPLLSEKQAISEQKRPKRLDLEQIIYHNKFTMIPSS